MSSSILELGLYALFGAASAVGAITALRQAPLIRDWNEEGVRPWACDLCMSFWVTLGIAVLGYLGAPEVTERVFWAWMASFALAYTWVTRLTPAPPDGGEFPGLPDEPDEGDESG